MNRRSLLAFLAAPALATLPLAVAGDPAAQPPAPASAPAAPAPAPTPAPAPAPEEKVVNRVAKENGLVIEDLVIGDGPEVAVDGVVIVHTSGFFKDGSKFYDSRDAGRPMVAPLGLMTMEGWKQGVPGMKKGGKRRLMVPASLAYGEKGQPPRIPPNADLTFTIDLVDLLVMEDISEGTGDPVPPDSTVTVQYKGTFENGEVFDSTDGKAAVTLPLGNFIPGWQFGIPGMKKGGVRKLIVPYALAYGEQGRNTIPPKTNLTFVITLEDFKPPTPPPAPAPTQAPAPAPPAAK